MKKTLTFVYPDGLKTAHSRMYDAGFIHKFQKWGSLRKEECLNFNDKKMKLLLTFREVEDGIFDTDWRNGKTEGYQKRFVRSVGNPLE